MAQRCADRSANVVWHFWPMTLATERASQTPFHDPGQNLVSGRHGAGRSRQPWRTAAEGLRPTSDLPVLVIRRRTLVGSLLAAALLGGLVASLVTLLVSVVRTCAPGAGERRPSAVRTSTLAGPTATPSLASPAPAPTPAGPRRRPDRPRPQPRPAGLPSSALDAGAAVRGPSDRRGRRASHRRRTIDLRRSVRHPTPPRATRSRRRGDRASQCSGGRDDHHRGVGRRSAATSKASARA